MRDCISFTSYINFSISDLGMWNVDLGDIFGGEGRDYFSFLNMERRISMK